MDYFEFDQEAIIRKKELTIIDFDGELAINDTEKGIHYGINNVGSMIWKLLDEPQTINSLVGFLLTKYEIDKQKCQEEVSDFIRDLYERELICIDI
ncbi:MAG: hypothetical protein CVV00_04045 [Firmicutes bacterium HGW-Firmicutes-5]|nr:MAG: hypothetical protein CVV00_04045 [Firmicutes bacterium HGW-Firmicutes-5]